MDNKLKSLILKILDDDHGINEEAWDMLIAYLEEFKEIGFKFYLSKNVIAINGRRCLAIKTKEKIWEALEKEATAPD